jgi:hypothetical protein
MLLDPGQRLGVATIAGEGVVTHREVGLNVEQRK